MICLLLWTEREEDEEEEEEKKEENKRIYNLEENINLMWEKYLNGVWFGWPIHSFIH